MFGKKIFKVMFEYKKNRNEAFEKEKKLKTVKTYNFPHP